MREKEIHRFVLRRGAARIDDHDVTLEDLFSITGEISDYITVYEYGEEGRRFREKTLPLGRVIFKIRDGRELVFNAINPIVKVEDIVIKLNAILKERDLNVFTQKTSSTRIVSYER